MDDHMTNDRVHHTWWGAVMHLIGGISILAWYTMTSSRIYDAWCESRVKREKYRGQPLCNAWPRFFREKYPNFTSAWPFELAYAFPLPWATGLGAIVDIPYYWYKNGMFSAEGVVDSTVMLRWEHALTSLIGMTSFWVMTTCWRQPSHYPRGAETLFQGLFVLSMTLLHPAYQFIALEEGVVKLVAHFCFVVSGFFATFTHFASAAKPNNFFLEVLRSSTSTFWASFICWYSFSWFFFEGFSEALWGSTFQYASVRNTRILNAYVCAVVLGIFWVNLYQYGGARRRCAASASLPQDIKPLLPEHRSGLNL